MNDTPDIAPADMDWLTSPAPLPHSLDPAMQRQDAPAATAQPPRAAVTPLRPLDRLAADLDGAPVAAEPDGDPGGTPFDGDGNPDPAADAIPPDPSGQRPSSDRPRGEIWKGCPVRPLGHRDGVFYYLDPHGQLRGLTKHAAQDIMGLFGHRLPALYHAFPKFVADRKTGELYRKAEHFDHQFAASAMFKACGERGIFDPAGAIRGPGAWLDDEGNLIYHAGDALLIKAEACEPTTIDGKVYTASPPIPHPAAPPKDAGKPTDDAAAALDYAASWQWERPEIDPFIVLGMTGIQMLGGAMAWRPVFWNTGPRSAGKSTFQNWLKALQGGDKGLIKSADATKSGITSRIGHSSLPVSIDELEPGDEHSTKERDIIALARIAASGDQWVRGSADQKGASGNVFSTFFFSSILIPGKLEASDKSRLVILGLRPFPEGTPPLKFRAETWRERGARIKRDLIARWPSWEQRLDLWREALAEHRITGRNADNYGAILAMAQMALSEAMPTAEELTGWSAKIATHVKAELVEIGDDSEEVTTWLLSQRFDPFRRGEQHTLASWIKAAGWRPGAGKRIFSDSGEWHPDDVSKKANASLATIGLRVVGSKEEPVLFVATKPLQGLSEIFSRSKWAGGAWTQSLQRIAGAKASAIPRYLGGIQTRGTEVPFQAMPGLLSLEDGAEVLPASPHAPPDHEDFA